MEITVTLLTLLSGLVVSLILALVTEEFFFRGFFRMVYAQQSRRPQDRVTRPPDRRCEEPWRT
jgi:hypothetical protein